ncbi:MAG: hypothetical protein L0323_22615 [Planctomycetes bacterium]|nr:hypothetical protein [Planctomycetota bacterium]
MRALADEARIREFLRALGGEAKAPCRLYLTGGATAVLLGWRETTVDVDVKFVPEAGEVFDAIPRLKESLRINVELASPSDFIPPLPGWEDRSRFEKQEGRLAVYHYDFYSQALAKLEREHEQDLEDVREMIRRRLVEPAKLLEFFQRIEADLRRYPAIDPPTFRRSVEEMVRGAGSTGS